MMPYLRVLTSQPQGAVEIDWSNPITRGLVSAVNIATGRDHKGNRISLISGASYTPTSDGIGILSNGSSSYGLMNINQKTYSELTIVAVTIPVSLATSRTIVDVGHSSNANPIFRITTGNTDSSKIRFWLRGDNGGGLNSFPDSTNTAFVVGKKSVLSFYAKGSSGKCYCYINGKKDVAGTTTIANTWTINRLSIGVAYFGGSTGDFYNGNTPLALLYERELSGEEHRALSDNPWQIFKPRSFLLVSPTIKTATGGASALGTTAKVSTSLVTTTGTAAATGTTAKVSTSLVTTTGNASALGTTALVSSTIQTALGNASATGTTALVSPSIKTTLGDASATGITASITTTSNTVITTATGTASAAGTTALANLTTQTSAGNAAAAGTTSLVSRTIQTAEGTASALGIAALISPTIKTTVGDASALGITASISTASNTVITTTTGTASAAGITAFENVTIQAAAGSAPAAGTSALVSTTLQTTTGTASAAGITALENITVQAAAGGAQAAGVDFLLLGNTVIQAFAAEAAANGIDCSVIALSTSLEVGAGPRKKPYKFPQWEHAPGRLPATAARRRDDEVALLLIGGL